MVITNLRAWFKRRPVTTQPAEPQVLVSLECPWEDEPATLLGAAREVLKDRTLHEVVGMVAQQRGRALPDTYALHVRRPGGEEYEPAAAEVPARSFLGSAVAPADGTAYQLCILVLPACDTTQPHQQRSSDLEEAAETPDLALQPAPLASLSEEEKAAKAAAEAMEAAEAIKAMEAAAEAIALETVELPVAEAEKGKKPRGYLRKADVLRHQMLPKIAELDFRGLFVGNFGPLVKAPLRGPRLSFLSTTEANKYLLLANQHLRTGKLDQAARYYRTLIVHDPDNKDYWFLLGIVEQGRGGFERAVHAYRNASRLGHVSARAQIEKIEAQYGAVAEGPRAGALLSLMQLTYPREEAHSEGDGCPR